MAKNTVLDALIPREDFEIQDETGGTTRNVATIGARDLEKTAFFYAALRKPDFQRETNEWNAKRIASLVESFISGELIPAVILWRSPSSFTFVIDGAHRLSALCAWINNDYGDGDVSKIFFDGIIPEEQLLLAEKTRVAIRKEIGLFSDYQLALTHPDKVPPEIVERAKSMGALAIQVQWVEGNAQNAESSFFKINQQAAAIDKTELKLLQSRRKPNGIATRAILRSGKGHKYWSSYKQEIQEEIQSLSSEINEVIFQPPLKSPIKTLDLPLGGKNLSSQGQSLVLELVNKSNNINKSEELDDDSDGSKTVKYLKNCLRVVRRINSIHPSSLGLHPAIYFYSKEGKHKPASFWAAIEFVRQLEQLRLFNDFTDVRESFESFLMKYDYLIQQIVRKYRSAAASYPNIAKLYLAIVESLASGTTLADLPKRLKENKDFTYLVLGDSGGGEISSPDFTSERKTTIFFREALQNSVKCAICNGLLHKHSITIDHIERKQDGGLGAVNNGQLSHPYCNTTYKN
ncbi:MAG: DUF262 domain-containing protein [Thiotrichaceae bacterium]